ncbi:hypothetical protein [Pseudoalteromonas lipolytica]
MAKGSLYSVSDKAMFDAINQSKVTNSDLKGLFLTRGILISAQTKRKSLATYFSMFPHTYKDYKVLADILGTNTRKEKNTSTRLDATVNKEIIETAAVQLISELEHYGVDCSIDMDEKNDSLNIDVIYEEFDYTSSEFKQVIKKSASIIVELDENGIVIRHPQNKTVEEWKASFISKLEVELEEELLPQNISLSHITNHSKVTIFFESLIDNLDGYNLEDVTDVYVYHPKGLENDFENDTGNEDVDLGTHISKASLKGQNVLNSNELKQLYDKGFYISKIVWRSKKGTTIDADIYEFEAQFSDAETREQFSYLAKGFYSYKESGGGYVKSRKGISAIQERELNQLIERFASNILSNI